MIGENINKIRMMRGLTLSELAERAQISKSYLSNIERNLNQNPSIQIVEKVATVLGVDFRTLLGSKPMDSVYKENEWIEFANELKDLGVKKDQLQTYKTVIQFAKWQQENSSESK
jgi:XRE family transcriptional regulator of biofilm formation